MKHSNARNDKIRTRNGITNANTNDATIAATSAAEVAAVHGVV